MDLTTSAADDAEEDAAQPPQHDVRMAVVGAAGWSGGLAAHAAGGWSIWLAVAGAVAGCVLVARGQRRPALLVVACALVCLGVVGTTLLRGEVVTHGILPSLAEQRAVAEVTGVVVSDPVTLDGQWGRQAVVRVRVTTVTARGATYRLGAVVVVLGDPAWGAEAIGSEVRTVGRLAPADDDQVAALVVGARPPVRIRGPDIWWRGAAAVRSSIRDAVAGRPATQRALVPALVDGDDAGLPPDLEADFRTTGLTHLIAVSGTNLTLVVGFVLMLARSLGVRRRWLTVVGLAGIAGFVLLARTEPSVVRAAAMGTVGLFALGTDGRRRGLRALGVAVTVLLLLSPALAVSAGFALSVLATAGIVVIGPPIQEALARWLPTPVAGAVAVPFAAQLACTPVIAALSGQVSLVAVLANLMVAPVVGPATVLGLTGGLVGLVSDSLGRACGTAAGACVWWVVLVAQRGADLPGASIAWGAGAPAIAVLVSLCAAVGVGAPVVLRHRRVGVALTIGALAVVLGVPGEVVPLPSSWPGAWPPKGWVLVACDVGQGDALVLSVAPHSAVVIDTGPEPDLLDDCLDRLHVTQVPLVVLTHFHADHINGLDALPEDRRVAQVWESPLRDPLDGAEHVDRWAAALGLTPTVPAAGTVADVGPVHLEVLGPTADFRPAAPNDGSIVMLVEVGGVRLLLTGDIEPPAQESLARAVGDLQVDVLKVPHHGSRYQDPDLLLGLHPRLAVISVGADNDYGHPDPGLVSLLSGAGIEVHRTDEEGDVAVIARGGTVSMASRG